MVYSWQVFKLFQPLEWIESIISYSPSGALMAQRNENKTREWTIFIIVTWILVSNLYLEFLKIS